MIRTIITPDTDKFNLILSVPENYIGKELEVIAFAKDEGIEKRSASKERVSFTVLHTERASAKDVFKALKFDTRGFKFNRDEANSR